VPDGNTTAGCVAEKIASRFGVRADKKSLPFPDQNAKKAPVLHGAFLVSPHLPWAVGLTTSTNQVGSSQAASGVPLKGGLAHSNPLRIPIKNYSAWAFLASPVG